MCPTFDSCGSLQKREKIYLRVDSQQINAELLEISSSFKETPSLTWFLSWLSCWGCLCYSRLLTQPLAAELTPFCRLTPLSSLFLNHTLTGTHLATTTLLIHVSHYSLTRFRSRLVKCSPPSLCLIWIARVFICLLILLYECCFFTLNFQIVQFSSSYESLFFLSCDHV